MVDAIRRRCGAPLPDTHVHTSTNKQGELEKHAQKTQRKGNQERHNLIGAKCLKEEDAEYLSQLRQAHHQTKKQFPKCLRHE